MNNKNKISLAFVAVLMMFGQLEPLLAQQAPIDVPPPLDVVLEHMEKGMEFQQQGELDQALKHFEKVLQLDPEHAEALFLGGNIYLNKGEIDKGLAYQEKSLALAPDNLRLRMALAATYRNIGRIEDAVNQYQEVLAIGKETKEGAEAVKNLRVMEVRAQVQRGEQEQALQGLDKLLSDYPDDIAIQFEVGTGYMILGQLAEAEELLTSALQQQPDSVAAYLNLANIYSRQGKTKEMLQALHTMRDLPASERLLARAARLANEHADQLFQGEDVEQALEVYRWVLEVNPQNLNALGNVGILHRKLGNFDEAEAAFRAAIDIAPDHIRAHSNLAHFYYETRQLQPAIEEYETLEELGQGGPVTQDARRTLIELLAIRGEQAIRSGRVAEGVEDFQRAKQYDPSNTHTLFTLAALLQNQGMLDEAQSNFEALLELDPDHINAHINLGKIFDGKGRYDDAASEYAAAIALDIEGKATQSAVDKLALVKGRKLFDEGRFDEAEAEFSAAVEDNPVNAVGHSYLALIYMQRKEPDKAVQEYDKVKEINPNNIGAYIGSAGAYEQLGLEEEAAKQYRYVIQAVAPGPTMEFAKESLDIVNARINGFSFGMDYSLAYDTNINSSTNNPEFDYRSDLGGSLTYRYKPRPRLNLSAEFRPRYSIIHRDQRDFLSTSFIPALQYGPPWKNATLIYTRNKSTNLLEGEEISRYQELGVTGLFRFNMSSLPFDAFQKQEDISSRAIARVGLMYRDYEAESTPAVDSETYTLNGLLTLNPKLGLITLGYAYSQRDNKQSVPFASDFAYSSDEISIRLEKFVRPGVSVNANYSFSYFDYDNADTLFKEFLGVERFRNNKLHLVMLGANWQYDRRMRFFTSYSWQKNDSNLATGVEEIPAEFSDQISALGSYRRQAITVGMALKF